MSFVRCWRLLCLFFSVVSSTPFIATPSLSLFAFAKGFTLACAAGLWWCPKKKEKSTWKSNSNLPWILLWSLSKRMAAIDIEIEIQFICILPFLLMLIFVVVVAVVVVPVVGARKPNLQLISVANWVKVAWRLCVYGTHLLRIRPVRPSICELLLVKQRAQSIGQFMEIIWAPPYTLQ